jgi:ubiquinone/menaquinone biosynthesis C-methylase UbiE
VKPLKQSLSSDAQTSFHCVSCNSEDSHLLHLVPGHYSAEIYNVVACSSCGLIQVHPRPTKQYLKSFYNSHSDADPSASLPYRISVFVQILAQIEEWYPNPASILDVGCGNGSFLEIAKKFSRNVYGVDTSASCCRTCSEKGLTVCCGELEEVNLPTASFDVVTLFHVIEHVLDPRSFLAEVRRILKVGGGVVVRTPNIDSKISRVTGRYWGWMNPPFHLNYFSSYSLSKILNNAGFSVDFITMRLSPEHNKNFFTELMFSMYRGLTAKMMHGTYSKESMGRKVHFHLTTGPIKRVLTTPTFLDDDKEVVAFARKRGT